MGGSKSAASSAYRTTQIHESYNAYKVLVSYGCLDLSRPFNEKDFRAKIKAVVRKLHPDQNKEVPPQLCKEFLEARDIVLNPIKRKMYLEQYCKDNGFEPQSDATGPAPSGSSTDSQSQLLDQIDELGREKMKDVTQIEELRLEIAIQGSTVAALEQENARLHEELEAAKSTTADRGPANLSTTVAGLADKKQKRGHARAKGGRANTSAGSLALTEQLARGVPPKSSKGRREVENLWESSKGLSLGPTSRTRSGGVKPQQEQNRQLQVQQKTLRVTRQALGALDTNAGVKEECGLSASELRRIQFDLRMPTKTTRSTVASGVQKPTL